MLYTKVPGAVFIDPSQNYNPPKENENENENEKVCVVQDLYAIFHSVVAYSSLYYSKNGRPATREEEE